MRDGRFRAGVDRGRNSYRTHYRDRYVQRDNSYRAHWDRYRPYYSQRWWNRGFLGYYYSYRPVLDIDLYFWNPLVYWFYSSDYDSDYYSDWYGSDYVNYPEFSAPFNRAGIFAPTEDFRDLLLGLSDLDLYAQDNLVVGLTRLISQVEVQLNVQLGTGDIVVDHYQVIDDDAVVVSGVIDQGDFDWPFEALIDLRDPNQNIVFIPSSPYDQDPSLADLAQLDALNNRIVDMGGDIETAQP
jgi:hypothetical protein